MDRLRTKKKRLAREPVKRPSRKRARFGASGSAFAEWSSAGRVLHLQNTDKCYVQCIVEIQPDGRMEVSVTGLLLIVSFFARWRLFIWARLSRFHFHLSLIG